MAQPTREVVFQHVCELMHAAGVQGRTDAELLQQFAAERNEAAFATLLQRHGRLVWSVCRKILGQEQDAEDAFQATFLVLSQKAASIRRGQTAASWLYRVAYRTALRARAARGKRQEHERRAARVPRISTDSEPAWRELHTALTAEVDRLPEKYRAPFVLCLLEGKSRAEAAQELGLKEGTVSSRVDRARKQLQARLTRRGFGLPALLAATALAETTEAANLPPTLLPLTLRAALGFAGRAAAAGMGANAAGCLALAMLRAMATARLKSVVLFLAAGVVVFGTGWMGYRALAGASQVTQPQEAERVEPSPLPPGARQASPRPSAQAQAVYGRRNPQPVDAFGDPLPAGALARIGTIRLRHAGEVDTLACSPDGRTIVSGSADESLRLWDVATGRELRQLQGKLGQIHAVAFSPDGLTVAAGGGGSPIVRLWDARTGQELRELHGQSAWTHALAFSRDGRLLVAGGGDKKVHVWEVATGKEVQQFEGHQEEIRAVGFLPNGKFVFSASRDRTLRLWDIVTGNEVQRLKVQQADLFEAALSPDGRMAAVIGPDHPIHLWNLLTGQQIRTVGGFSGAAQCVTFSPDSGTLVCGGEDHCVHLWDVAAGKETGRLMGPPGTITSVTFSADGRRLWAASNILRLWDLASRKQILPVGKEIGDVSCVAFSRDGRLLVSGGKDGSVRLWEPTTGKELGDWRAQSGEIQEMALAPDGQTLALSSETQGISCRDVRTGREVFRPRMAHRKGGSLAWSPDGKLLATTNEGEPIHIWDIATSQELGRLGVGVVAGGCLAISPDGQTLASWCRDSTVCLWDVVTGKELRHLGRAQKDGEFRDSVSSLAFSPDGQTLAVVWTGHMRPGQIDLWEVRTGRHLGQLRGGQRDVTSVAFSPDGRSLAAGDADQAVHLWELATGQERRRLVGHRSKVYAVVFSPCGNTLASVSWDNTALVWDMTAPLGNQPKGLEALWADLASMDAMRAYDALCLLVQERGSAVAFLRGRLKPAPAADPAKVTRLMQALDSKQFTVREKAMAELKTFGEAIGPALRKALQAPASPEARGRLDRLLRRLDSPVPPADQLRVLRAIEALERIGTPAAREVLVDLSKGAAACRQTQEAKASLKRLKAGP